MRKIIKHHIEGGTRESHPRVQDLQHPRLGKPRRGLQIFDTRMGFPRPSLNVVLDSINPSTNKPDLARCVVVMILKSKTIKTLGITVQKGWPRVGAWMGTLKNPTKCLWRWDPDCRSNFFSPLAHL